VAPWRLSCIRQYWHRPSARARTVPDSASETLTTAACLKSAMPRRGRATVARSIQPMHPVLLFQLPAKALRCFGPLVPEGDGLPSLENADFQPPLSSQPVRQLLNPRNHLTTRPKGVAVDGSAAPKLLAGELPALGRSPAARKSYAPVHGGRWARSGRPLPWQLARFLFDTFAPPEFAPGGAFVLPGRVRPERPRMRPVWPHFCYRHPV